VAFLCVASVLNLAQFRQDVLQASPDRAANTDRRFEALRRALSGRERVGYIADEPSFAEPAAERYFLAQLALAPVVVENSTSLDLVVGNFGTAPPWSILPELVLVRDFGDGVMLFRKR